MLTKVPAENVESMDIFVKCTEACALAFRVGGGEVSSEYS